MADEYRALYTGDIHLSNKLPHAKLLPGPDGITDRFQQQLEIMDAIGDRAEMEGVSDIYILGDLFDKPVLETVTLREATKCFRRWSDRGLNVWIGAGNHESPTISGKRHVTEFLQEFPLSNVQYMGRNWTHSPAPWMKMWWVPWGPVHETKERIEEIQAEVAKGGDRFNVLLLHQSVNGCTAGGWKCDDGLDPVWLTEDFDAVFSGHFHDPQEFGTCGMYLGSPLQLHFGDVGGERVYWDITMRPGEDAAASACATKHARFHQFDVEKPGEIRAPSEIAPGDYLRYVMRCSPEEWTKNKTVIDAAVKKVSGDVGCTVKIVHRPIAKSAVRLGGEADSLSYEEMMAKYIEAANPSGLDAKWLAEIGSEALLAVRSLEDG